jgi:hypothetical protein
MRSEARWHVSMSGSEDEQNFGAMPDLVYYKTCTGLPVARRYANNNAQVYLLHVQAESH